jgi:hypothetical protein
MPGTLGSEWTGEKVSNPSWNISEYNLTVDGRRIWTIHGYVWVHLNMRYGMPMIMSETMEIQGCPPFLVKPKKMSKCLGFVTLPKLTQTSPNRGFKKVDSTKNWLCSWVFRSILKQFIIYLVPHHQPLSLVSSIRVNYDSSVTHFLFKVFFGIVHPMRPYNSHYSRFRSQ